MWICTAELTFLKFIVRWIILTTCLIFTPRTLQADLYTIVLLSNVNLIVPYIVDIRTAHYVLRGISTLLMFCEIQWPKMDLWCWNMYRVYSNIWISKLLFFLGLKFDINEIVITTQKYIILISIISVIRIVIYVK